MSPSGHTVWSETLIFLGAGATAALNMPPSWDQGKILFSLCEKECIVPEDLPFKCFNGCRQDICDLMNILSYKSGEEYLISKEQREIAKRCFPEAAHKELEQRVLSLRQHYDWPCLQKIGKIIRNSAPEMPDEFIQSVFTTIDACLRDNRGITVDGQFFSADRLVAARELYILLINTMFACAWRQICFSQRELLTPYLKFTETLARMMQKDAMLNQGFPFDSRAFYLFNYSILTTNFEPIFLWLLWQAHKNLNREKSCYLGSPARPLQLFLDFPNTLAMREPKENGEQDNLDLNIWYPVTEAAAQKLNNPKHLSDRTVKLGKYYAVHGCSCFRRCPVCGRLSLHGGDSWDLYSPTIFSPGLTKNLSWGNAARSEKEKEAHHRGEYDAEECLFCGELTYAHDNYMYMQTKLKGQAPSFIKEITDETIAAIRGAKHIVLLGYSLPPDDAIWRSVMTAMTANHRQRPYCSVVCGRTGPQKWLYGEELTRYMASPVHGDIKPIVNAQDVFGKEQVRAYTGGIPQVFRDGDEDAVRDLLYAPEWIPKNVFLRR